MRAMKRCARCRGEFDAEAAFGRNHHARYTQLASGTRAVCLKCEQTARDAKKLRDRWPDKIRNTMTRHAKAFKTTASVLGATFGWAIDRMLIDAKRAYENPCADCGFAFSGMGHGLQDITLDVLDPTEEPFYRTNVRWICKSCNQEKSRKSPSQWGAHLVYVEAWKRQQERIAKDPSAYAIPQAQKLPFDAE